MEKKRKRLGESGNMCKIPLLSAFQVKSPKLTKTY